MTNLVDYPAWERAFHLSMWSSSSAVLVCSRDIKWNRLCTFGINALWTAMLTHIYNSPNPSPYNYVSFAKEALSSASFIFASFLWNIFKSYSISGWAVRKCGRKNVLKKNIPADFHSLLRFLLWEFLRPAIGHANVHPLAQSLPL